MLSKFVSTAGRFLALIMRTCSAFGGFVKSSWASAVAGASSASTTTGADGGLRRQAPMVAPSGCLLAARGLGWAALALAALLRLDLAEPDTGLLDPDADLMGVRHQEEVGYVPSQVFAEAKVRVKPYLPSFTSLLF